MVFDEVGSNQCVWTIALKLVSSLLFYFSLVPKSKRFFTQHRSEALRFDASFSIITWCSYDHQVFVPSLCILTVRQYSFPLLDPLPPPEVDSDLSTQLEDLLKTIGAVSETLVNWTINKKLRHEHSSCSTLGVGEEAEPAAPSSEEIPVEEVELVKKFSNFLTRRNPRLYLPTLHNPTTGQFVCQSVHWWW